MNILGFTMMGVHFPVCRQLLEKKYSDFDFSIFTDRKANRAY